MGTHVTHIYDITTMMKNKSSSLGSRRVSNNFASCSLDMSTSHTPQTSYEETVAASINYGSVEDREERGAPDPAAAGSAGGCCRPVGSAVSRHLTMFTGLALATYAGVAARIGLTDFSNWDGIPTSVLSNFSSFWAQIVGTLIIGVAVGQEEKLQGTFPFLYTLVTIGVCGSLTTFSSWNVEASKVLLQLNDTSLEPLHHSINAGRIVGFATVLLLGVGMPVSVFILGKRVSSSLPIGRQNNRTFLAAFHRRRPWIFPATNILVSTSVTIIIVAICLYTEYYSFLFSLMFGGPGTYLRWRLSSLDKTNLKYIGGFPIGTLLANIIGSFILACTLVAISYNSSEILEFGSIWLAMLDGVAVGFCGSLTTVSTFVSQICSLSFCMSVCYVIISLVLSQVIINAVFLSYQALI